ncbi:hypothetical protein E2562_011991 [Oryza meyeriana var. granulata]|uniref:Uncharacterized protein n=1 Tax=Oryza meyeriana var. granulata TaxID=110450 RepID=A0A6G1F700_9ORYZ|nr:hypothetical protein E2562_011991 [Oryza meyeriana var. granulata]
MGLVRGGGSTSSQISTGPRTLPPETAVADQWRRPAETRIGSRGAGGRNGGNGSSNTDRHCGGGKMRRNRI